MFWVIAVRRIDVRVHAGAAVLRRVEHQLTMSPALHEVEDVGSVTVADLVR